MLSFLFFWPGAHWFGGRNQRLNSKLYYENTRVESFTFSLDVTAESESRTDTWLEVVSWFPRAFVLHNFLTPSECDHLIDEARDKLERSKILDEQQTKNASSALQSKVRTSSGTFLARLLVSFRESLGISKVLICFGACDASTDTDTTFLARALRTRRSPRLRRRWP